MRYFSWENQVNCERKNLCDSLSRIPVKYTVLQAKLYKSRKDYQKVQAHKM